MAYAHPILTHETATIKELKEDPMGIIAAGGGKAVAILDHDTPAFYCMPAKVYAYLQDLAEDEELNKLADQRMKNSKFVSVTLDEL